MATDSAWHRLGIDCPETFEIRRPLLDAVLAGRWRMADRETIEVNMPLSAYSGGERAIIEFVRNPYEPGKVFASVDTPLRRMVAKVIFELFREGGALDRKG